VPFVAALRRIVTARVAIRGRSVLTHNGGVAGSSPTPAIAQANHFLVVGSYRFQLWRYPIEVLPHFRTRATLEIHIGRLSSQTS
jgi:hypothetical protein